MSLKPNNWGLIIGAMKCGTTSLYYYLSEHPQVVSSSEKEVCFFSHDDLLARGMSWYRGMWKYKDSHRIAVEASPSYTRQPFLPNVAERIAKIKQVENAKFKFIYIIRHPLKRIESSITMKLQAQEVDNIPLPPPEEVTFEEEDLTISQYAMQLDAYIQAFGRDSLHILLLEDLQQNPQVELRKICEFLEIDPDYQFQNTDVVRNNRETLNLNPLISKLRHKPLIRFLVQKFTSPKLRQKLRGKLVRKNPFKVKLSDKDRETILKHLQPDLIRLETEYGVDVQGKWGLPIMTIL